MAAPQRQGVNHAKAIGNWMMNSSARDGGFANGPDLGIAVIG
jgi:hypothetical protein